MPFQDASKQKYLDVIQPNVGEKDEHRISIFPLDLKQLCRCLHRRRRGAAKKIDVAETSPKFNIRSFSDTNEFKILNTSIVQREMKTAACFIRIDDDASILVSFTIKRIKKKMENSWTLSSWRVPEEESRRR